jgi:flagellar biosynthesis anti-sigma factor FlgM
MDLRIPGSEVNSVSKAYKTRAATTNSNAVAQSSAPEAADSVVVSSNAEQTLDITKAAEAQAKALPDVRSEVVEALQEQIQNGQYQVNADKIAVKMLEDISGGSEE